MPYRTPSNLLGLTDRSVPEGYFWITLVALWFVSAIYHVILTGGLSVVDHVFVAVTAVLYAGLAVFAFGIAEVVFEVGRRATERIA